MTSTLLYFLLAFSLLCQPTYDTESGRIHTPMGITVLPDGNTQTEPNRGTGLLRGDDAELLEHPYIPPGMTPDAEPVWTEEDQRQMEAELAQQQVYGDYVEYLYQNLDETLYTWISFGDSVTSDMIIACLDRAAVQAVIDATCPDSIRVALIEGEGPSVADKRALYEAIIDCDLIGAHPERIRRVSVRGYGVEIYLLEPFEELRDYLAGIDFDPPLIRVHEGDYKMTPGGTAGLDGFLYEDTNFTEPG